MTSVTAPRKWIDDVDRFGRIVSGECTRCVHKKTKQNEGNGANCKFFPIT